MNDKLRGVIPFIGAIAIIVGAIAINGVARGKYRIVLRRRWSGPIEIPACRQRFRRTVGKLSIGNVQPLPADCVECSELRSDIDSAIGFRAVRNGGGKLIRLPRVKRSRRRGNTDRGGAIRCRAMAIAASIRRFLCFSGYACGMGICFVDRIPPDGH